MTTAPLARHWVAVCTVRQLIPERGVAVLVDEQQIALFRLRTGGLDRVHALGHHDPFSSANVMARGLVGSVTVEGEERDTVASPMFKHVFDLVTGECLNEPGTRIPTYRTCVVAGVVYVDRRAVALAATDLAEAG
jgi:nitrite reductase (NADH) small subunit